MAGDTPHRVEDFFPFRDIVFSPLPIGLGGLVRKRVEKVKDVLDGILTFRIGPAMKKIGHEGARFLVVRVHEKGSEVTWFHTVAKAKECGCFSLDRKRIVRSMTGEAFEFLKEDLTGRRWRASEVLVTRNDGFGPNLRN